jgi:hypothetical protein
MTLTGTRTHISPKGKGEGERKEIREEKGKAG